MDKRSPATREIFTPQGFHRIKGREIPRDVLQFCRAHERRICRHIEGHLKEFGRFSIIHQLDNIIHKLFDSECLLEDYQTYAIFYAIDRLSEYGKLSFYDDYESSFCGLNGFGEKVDRVGMRVNKSFLKEVRDRRSIESKTTFSPM